MGSGTQRVEGGGSLRLDKVSEIRGFVGVAYIIFSLKGTNSF